MGRQSAPASGRADDMRLSVLGLQSIFIIPYYTALFSLYFGILLCTGIVSAWRHEKHRERLGDWGSSNPALAASFLRKMLMTLFFYSGRIIYVYHFEAVSGPDLRP